MVKSSKKRSESFDNKNDPIVIALRFKAYAINFQPTAVNFQIFNDNFDKVIASILDDLGFDPLHRLNAKNFVFQFMSVIQQFSGQTLINKLKDMAQDKNLTVDEMGSIIVKINQLLTAEKIAELCDPALIALRAVRTSEESDSFVILAGATDKWKSKENRITTNVIWNPID